jgi:hypothetical protein
MFIWNIALYGSETGTLWKTDQKQLESSEMQCLRRMGKISWTDHLQNDVLHRVKEERNILHIIKTRNAKGLVTHCVGTAL